MKEENRYDWWKLMKEKISDRWEKFKNTKFAKQIPNIITWTRIGASVAAPICFLSRLPGVAIGLWIGGAASDAIDGFAARKLDAFSEFGRKLDAVSDKIFALSILAPSIILGNYFMLIPLLFEALISHVNLKGQKLGFNPETTRVGKRKTVWLFITLIASLISLSAPLAIAPPIKYFILTLMFGGTTYLQAKTFKEYKEYFDQKLAEQSTVPPAAQEVPAAPSLDSITAPVANQEKKPLHQPPHSFNGTPRGSTCPTQPRTPGSLSRALTPEQKKDDKK